MKILLKKIIPEKTYNFLRKLRLYMQFKYIELRYRGKKERYYYKGHDFLIRSGTDDKDIVKEIIDGHYEIGNKNYDIIVDIGAHIGIFSIFMSKRANKIYSFEPNPESFEILKENVEDKKINNVFIFPLAIANSKRKDRLYISPYSTGACSIYETEPTKSVEIKTITMQDFIEHNKIKKIDLLKMDCEGAEYEIMKSLEKRNLSKIKNIAMEVHHFDNTFKNYDWMVNFLKRNNFVTYSKLNKINGNKYLFAKVKE